MKNKKINIVNTNQIRLVMDNINVKQINNMRDYSITRKKGEWYDARVVDSFGNKYQNYFEFAHEANDWIYYIWENEKPPLTEKEEMDLLANAIWGCTKLDEELGLLKGNEDNLD